MLAAEVDRRRGGIVAGRPHSLSVETIRVSNFPSKSNEEIKACWFSIPLISSSSPPPPPSSPPPRPTPSFLLAWRNESMIASVTDLCKRECHGNACTESTRLGNTRHFAAAALASG